MYELKLNFKPLMKKLEVVSKKEIFGGMFSGSYTSKFKGKGLEFYGFREYTPADDASRIDWKASLRANKLLVKEFTEERAVNVVFAVDVSSSMSYSSIAKLKNEFAAELTASIAFSILKSGDSIGLLMFTDQVRAFLPPKLGKKQYYLMLKMLSNPKLYDGGFDIKKPFMFLTTALRKGSVVILISDFIGLRPGWQQSLDLITKKFDVIGIMVRDPADNTLPERVGPVVVSSPFSDEELLFDPDRVREDYERLTRAERAFVKQEFMKRKCSFLELQTNEPFQLKVERFFKQRYKLTG